jgi:putative tryptophan/tyrosine transport system substrate-binding protein
MHDLNRRDFITLLGSATAWPIAARAQKARLPVLGLLTARAKDDAPHLMAAIHQGLNAAGFIEGQNVAIEYRIADNRNDRLPALAADLVQRQVAVIAATTTPAAVLAPSRRLAACIIAMSVELPKMGEAARCRSALPIAPN